METTKTDMQLPNSHGASEERPSLGEALEAASMATSPDNPTQTTKANRLIHEHRDILGRLAFEIGSFTPLLGTRGLGGYEDPTKSLARKYKSGNFDGMLRDDYERMRDSYEELAMLWEGQSSAHGMHLACNAILYCVLNDPALREEVFMQVCDWLERHRRVLEDVGLPIG